MEVTIKEQQYILFYLNRGLDQYLVMFSCKYWKPVSTYLLSRQPQVKRNLSLLTPTYEQKNKQVIACYRTKPSRYQNNPEPSHRPEREVQAAVKKGPESEKDNIFILQGNLPDKSELSSFLILALSRVAETRFHNTIYCRFQLCHKLSQSFIVRLLALLKKLLVLILHSDVAQSYRLLLVILFLHLQVFGLGDFH